MHGRLRSYTSGFISGDDPQIACADLLTASSITTLQKIFTHELCPPSDLRHKSLAAVLNVLDPLSRFDTNQRFADQSGVYQTTLNLPNGTWEVRLTAPKNGVTGKATTESVDPLGTTEDIPLTSWGNCVPDADSDLIRCRSVSGASRFETFQQADGICQMRFVSCPVFRCQPAFGSWLALLDCEQSIDDTCRSVAVPENVIEGDQLIGECLRICFSLIYPHASVNYDCTPAKLWSHAGANERGLLPAPASWHHSCFRVPLKRSSRILTPFAVCRFVLEVSAALWTPAPTLTIAPSPVSTWTAPASATQTLPPLTRIRI